MRLELTSKQDAFCRNVVAGMSNKDAYIAAYQNKSNDYTAQKEATKLLARDDIQKRIKELNKPLEIQAQSTALSEREKKRSIIWDRIESCILSGDDAAIARYMDILNKMDSEYININRNIDENKTEINTLDTETLTALAGIN